MASSSSCLEKLFTLPKWRTLLCWLGILIYLSLIKLLWNFNFSFIWYKLDFIDIKHFVCNLFLQVLLLARFNQHVVFKAAGRVKWLPESLQDRHGYISYTLGHTARGLTGPRREAASPQKTWAKETPLQGPSERTVPDQPTKALLDVLHQMVISQMLSFIR